MKAIALPLLAVIGTAVLWGLYSNLVRRFAARGSVLGVPLFMLAGGLLLVGSAASTSPTRSANTASLASLTFCRPTIRAVRDLVRASMCAF